METRLKFIFEQIGSVPQTVDNFFFEWIALAIRMDNNFLKWISQAIRGDEAWRTLLAPVVQTLDSAIHRINHYPADKYYGNQLRYPLDSDLSGG